MPWSGPRGPLALRSASSASAIVTRVGIDLDDRAERRTGAVDLLDPREVELDELPRRVPARLHPLLQLLDRHLVELERSRRRLRACGHEDDRPGTATDNTDKTDAAKRTKARRRSGAACRH